MYIIRGNIFKSSNQGVLNKRTVVITLIDKDLLIDQSVSIKKDM